MQPPAAITLLCLRVSLQAFQSLLIKFIGELPFHLFNLSSARVVPERAGHLLVGHGLAVPLATAP